MIASLNLKKYIKFSVKVCVTALAIYIVAKQVELSEAFQLILKSHPAWLLAAFIFFNASKGVSALRLNEFFRVTQVYLNTVSNIKLYYIGMFYNLFLPGSVGGDGYKIYLLNKIYSTSVKGLISASLLDRLSGVAALSFLAGILFYFSSYHSDIPHFNSLVVAATLFVFPIYFWANYLFFRKFLKVFISTSLFSILVQLLQLVCALSILYALSINGNYINYLALFLISSVVSILPITVGGVGARELVFLFGYQFLEIDKTESVSFTLLFFLITAVSSLAGVFLNYEPKPVKI